MLGNGIYAELDKVNALATQFTGDVTVQMKSPPSCNGAESVEEHPHVPEGNAHKVMFCGDLTAKHNKFKVSETLCILGIVVLAHKLRK